MDLWGSGLVSHVGDWGVPREYCYFPDKVDDQVVILGEIGPDFLIMATEIDKDSEDVFGDGLIRCQ